MNHILQDITKIDYGIICHQVNCKGVMGAGLAQRIKEKFSEVYQIYVDRCNDLKSFNLGTTQLLRVEHNTLYVANIFGQDSFGRDRCYTNMDAVDRALGNLKLLVEDNKETRFLPIYFPYLIGCGLGGGSWNEYSKLIETWFSEANICYLTTRKLFS